MTDAPTCSIRIVEDAPCPSCGRKTLSFWEDPTGWGGQCVSMDCLEFWEGEELLAEPDAAKIQERDE